MCGLIFIHKHDGVSAEHRATAKAALKKLQHRGPDDHGLVETDNTLLGHRRLAIIDLQASRQPMQDTASRYILSYNGEVYNFKELRATLAQHWTFRTSGDTEVVLAGLILQGQAFVQQMEGMWALAFWDRKEETLWLSRDRMGKKPLFYANDSQDMVCASELPALKLLLDRDLQEDPRSTADYLRYGYFLPGTTAYKSIKEVLPGHNLSWSPNVGTRSSSYWNLSMERFRDSEQDACDRLRQAMIASVRKRMIADVEVGAFLSGGVDSSLITAVMTKYCDVSPKTFTIGFSEVSYDERYFAKTISDHCNTRHYEECLRSWDTDSLQSLVYDHVGQPFADSSLLPTSLVSELAARQVKVALSGDGGDELFSGYQRYQARAILRWYTRLPVVLRNNIDRLIKFFPEPMAHHSRSLLKKAHLFVEIAQRSEDERPYVAPLMYSNKYFRQLVPDLFGLGHAPPGVSQQTEVDELQSMMASDALVYLPQDILLKVDRASMAHSLETRAPFLDREVVELAFSLPPDWHRRGLSGKRMLYKTFSGLLPREIWRRRKQGFGVPIHDWFRQDLGKRLEELLAVTSTAIDEDFVRLLLADHRRRTRDHGLRLWNIYMYLLWVQTERAM